MEKKESGSTSGSGSGIKPYRKEFLKPRGNWNKRERQVRKEGSTPSTANLRDYIGTSSPIGVLVNFVGAEIEVRDCVDLETNFSDKGAKTLYMVVNAPSTYNILLKQP
ncbi:hypothetical protein JHK87_012437 [Glycine soja]|nr:hypothetical protein JHK87_012437 [Glycine soja]